jgi:hypothetical protein
MGAVFKIFSINTKYSFMKKIFIKVMVSFLGIWIPTHDECVAQIDSTNQMISRAFQVTTAHLNPKECTAIETLVTIVVTFDSSASVENVFLSDSDDCLTQNKTGFTELLVSELNGLNLEKEEFSNSYILVVLFVTKLYETKITNSESTSVFVKMFRNLDEELVSGKELKLWMGMSLFSFGTQN